MDLRVRVALAVTAVAAYAVLSHRLMTHAPDSVGSLMVVLGPMLVAMIGSVWHLGQRLLAALLGLAAVGACLAVSRGASVPPQWLYLGQHAGIHAALEIGFGITLRPGARALITQIASRVHPLSPDMTAYTRRVTLAWTLYFLAVFAASLLLYAFAPFGAWSMFANIGTPVSLVAMFAGEHLLRYRLHPEFERVGIVASIRAYAQHQAPATEPNR